MFKPKRMFGQNFLIDQNIAAKIVRSAELEENDLAWEVGAGKGMLTAELLKTGCNLICFEIDRDLIDSLKERFGDSINLIAEDVLKADWRRMISESKKEQGEKAQASLVANIPYNITSPLLEKITENAAFFRQVIIMMQKEVAERITASPGSKSYGVMSLKIQHIFHVKKLFRVSPHLFRPRPKVDSEVIRMIPKKDIRVFEDERLFWSIVETSFRSRRKTLKNNLSSILTENEMKKLSGVLESNGENDNKGLDDLPEKPLRFSLMSRGESLNEEDFTDLYHLIRVLRK